MTKRIYLSCASTALYLLGEKYVFADLRKFQVRKFYEILGPKSANPQIATIANVRKFNKNCKLANLRICDLRNFLADRPHLLFFNSLELRISRQM
jgi:hypothetical protein